MPKAIDLMNADLIAVDPDDSIEEAIYRMLQHQLSGLPVVGPSDELLGMVSEFDLLDLVWDPRTSKNKVHQHMSREVTAVDENDDLSVVAEGFRLHSVRRLPVMRGGQLVGMIDRRDVLAYVLRARDTVVPAALPLPTPLYPAAQAHASL